MEDVVTEAPPPSRFFPEDLDTFAAPTTTTPPLLLLSPNPNPNPNPKLLILFISPASLALLHALPSSSLAATLLLPELPLAPAHLPPSPRDKSLHLYSHPAGGDALLAAVQLPVAAARARAVAKALVGTLRADEVLILDSIRSGNYRGRLAADEPLEYKLETAAARRQGGVEAARGVPWLPSGSVVDELGAAVMAECEMRKVAASMVVTWPESGRPREFAVLRRVAAQLGFDAGRAVAGGLGRAHSDLLYA